MRFYFCSHFYSNTHIICIEFNLTLGIRLYVKKLGYTYDGSKYDSIGKGLNLVSSSFSYYIGSSASLIGYSDGDTCAVKAFLLN